MVTSIHLTATNIPTASDSPIAELLQGLLEEALTQGASDIHFEPQEKGLRVRYRIDGHLYVAATPALAVRDRLLSRLKVLARLDIAEKRTPQDGRMGLAWQGRWVNLRVSSLPTLHGEKLVVRVLESHSGHLDLQALGYSPAALARLQQALRRPDGLILITGPTGSGKTRSLYSCLDQLNSSRVNIATVEDPAEIQLAGANQVSVNERAGLTFASTLRALLRQDPDILMVGEIRDLETARIALQAAQTGHLVLSTLHTQNAPSTLMRLQDMGVKPFHLAASVLLITAQRLVRRLCPHCKALHPPSLTWHAVGCAKCREGYAGRVGLFQVMPISDTMKTMMLQHTHAVALAAQAQREGIATLREDGLDKVRQGLTTLAEIEQAIHD
jgi:type IV pilus assembly protein PilB